VLHHLALLVALTVFLGACSSTDARTEALQQMDAAEDRLLRCRSQAAFGPEAILIEPKFEEVQRIIREDGVDALDEQQRTMFDALQEPTVVNEYGISYVEYLEPAYTPGETTMADLRRDVGLLEVLDYSALVADLWDDERTVLSRRYGRALRGECEANNVGALESICARTDNPESCRDFDTYKDRDLEAIAEACALAPYLAPCEPENPLTYYPPTVRDDYRLPIPDDPARR